MINPMTEHSATGPTITPQTSGGRHLRFQPVLAGWWWWLPAVCLVALVAMLPTMWRHHRILQAVDRLSLEWYDINYDAMAAEVMTDPEIGVAALRATIRTQNRMVLCNCIEVCWRQRGNPQVRELLADYVQQTADAQGRKWAQAVLDGTYETTQSGSGFDTLDSLNG